MSHLRERKESDTFGAPAPKECRTLFFPTLLFFVVLVMAGCGSDSPSVIPAPSSQESAGIQGEASVWMPAQGRHDVGGIDPRAKYWEPLIRSADYTGQIAVMFSESAGVRFVGGQVLKDEGRRTKDEQGGGIFRSKFNVNIKSLNDLMAAHPEVGIRMGLPDITQDELDQRVMEIRDVEGYPMTDWGSFYIIDVMDADEAMEMLSGLYQMGPRGKSEKSILDPLVNVPSPLVGEGQGEGLVSFAHPIPRAYPLGIQIPNITPGPGQEYLKDLASTGGLNVKAAWDAGLDGTGVVFIDMEQGWNVNHLDLSLSASSFISKANTGSDGQHGTAVAGILVGKNNGIGVTGMVPNAKMMLGQTKGAQPVGGIMTTLVKNQAMYADGSSSSDYMKPGDVYLIEVGVPPPWLDNCPNKDPNNPSNGCMPLEAYTLDALILKDLINYGGIVVVEGAANGGLNLDDPKNNIDFKFAQGDSTGAIMVGASMGGSTLLNGKHTLEKAPYSNCGSRVDVFAWGAGVVSTGYGDHAISVTKQASDPGAMKVMPELIGGATKYVDPNQAYTASFAGTSSATAIIAGSAALLQQYARGLYKDPQSACAIKTWEYVYLSSQQMRDVMVKSGTAPKPYISDPQLWNNYKDPNPGCNIGMQPDLAKAMQIIKDGCDGKSTGIKATVKTKDLKTFCAKATLSNPNPKKEPWCPDYGPLQPGIGKMMDIDGDGRADFISFSKDRKWYVDLSTVGPTQFSGMPFPPGKPKDNFGTWNLMFDLSKDSTLAKDAMLFPVVMDYNTDGKADLGLYDAVHGKWVVHFTTGNTLNTNNAVNGVNPWPGWDMVIDYSQQPHWKPYSRPVPGGYNTQDMDPYTFDNYMDIALHTPDGWLLVDYGGQNPKANYGSFDQMIQYVANGTLTYEALSEYVDKQITDAPIWAYLPIVYLASYDNASQNGISPIMKVPDDISNTSMSNRLLYWFNSSNKFGDPQKASYGPNDAVFSQGKFQTKSYADIGIKRACNENGFWQVATDQSGWEDLINIDPYIDFGEINCRPIPGDYDGDGYDDRAVQCGNVWKIAYTGSKYPINYKNAKQAIGCDGKTLSASETFRSISLPQVLDPLPGYVHPGGVSFKETKAIFETVNYLCPTVAPTGNNPPCTLLDMVPAPIGPYFPQCVAAVRKTYVADVCTNPSKKVSCETMRIQQAQCVWQ